jgi:hypothetical protein
VVSFAKSKKGHPPSQPASQHMCPVPSKTQTPDHRPSALRSRFAWRRPHHHPNKGHNLSRCMNSSW